MSSSLPVRLDKYLRDCTPLPLVELRMACAAGRVRRIAAAVSGADPMEGPAELAPEALVFPGDRVTLDGVAVEPREAQVALALHKPVGVTTTTRDPDGRSDLAPWLARMPAGVFPVGRLDRMTSGLLICTNDGDLAFAVASPTHHVNKCYRLTLGERVVAGDPRLDRLCRGVQISGVERPLTAAEVTVVRAGDRDSELELTVMEGKYRQVRKMCRAVCLPLVTLHRVSVGNVELGALSPGKFRSLNADEVEALWVLAGGRDGVRRRQMAALRARAAAARAAGAPEHRLEAWLEDLEPCR